MNKLLFGLLAVAGLSTAQAANYMGASVGYPNGLALHYQSNTGNNGLRYSLSLAPYETMGLGGGLDYMGNFSAARTASVAPYWGIGVDGVFFFSGGGAAYPHGLLGARFNVDPNMNVFGEVNAGYWLGFNGAVSRLRGGGRLGVNFRLR